MSVRKEALWGIAINMTDLVIALVDVLKQHEGHQELAAWAQRQAENARDDLTKEAILAQMQPERSGYMRRSTDPPLPRSRLSKTVEGSGT